MKIILIAVILLFSSVVCAQTGGPTNSLQETYLKANPGLHYKYRESELCVLHDYSENWDFDADGKKDKLLFVGIGGAHLYYYLNIALSTNNFFVKDYPFIVLDLPVLSGKDQLKNLPGFAVADFDGDSINDILIHIDKQSLEAYAKELKTLGITSETFLVTFKKGGFKFKNYPL